MDVDFETALLAFIDDFLASAGELDQFHKLKEELGRYYFDRSQSVLEPIERRYPKPVYRADQGELEEYRHWDGYAESGRVYEAQLPQERRLFFMNVLEQASFTTPEGWDPEERKTLHFLQLSEYVDFVRKEREQYRREFGR